MNKNDLEEVGERAIAGLYEENTGIVYKRQHVIAGRAMDAKATAAEKFEPVCDFKNQWGWCKLDKGHQGSHTVINLGEDDV